MVINALQHLLQAHAASIGEVLGFITTHALHGIGIGCVDVHLLISARPKPGTGCRGAAFGGGCERVI